jgi:hypothetical protein
MERSDMRAGRGATHHKHQPLTRLASLGTFSPLRGEREKKGYLIACGLIGDPVPPVMISGGPQKKNS